LKKSRYSTAVIGWIGSPSTAKYIEAIEYPLRYLSKKFSIRFIALGTKQKIIDQPFCTFQSWNRRREGQLLKAMSFGVMPLHTGPWEEGKCGYKIIQYLGNGKPCVASPTRFNSFLIKKSKAGYLAREGHEWIRQMEKLIRNPQKAKNMGLSGKEFIKKNFSTKIIAKKVISVLDYVTCN